MPKVAFVLGAGASRHLNFPTGGELIADIITTLSGDCPLADTINSMYGENMARELADELAEASLDSIDQFMRIQRSDTLRNACRFTLTFKILQAEHHSTATMHDRTNLQNNWYHLFRQFLLRNPHLICSECFSFLSFNYDRSFEHFLKKALDKDGRISSSANGLFPEVFHLHGSFGSLPWASRGEHMVYGGGDLFRFEDSPLEYVSPRPLVSNHISARTVANRITFPHDEIDYGLGIARRLAEIDLLVIIGFGFAPENCTKILLRDIANKGVPIIATATGLSEEKLEYLTDFSGLELVPEKSGAFYDKILRRRLERLFKVKG